MILDGEVSVLIPNPENRNFSHWLQTFIEERKNYERLIEREMKHLQLIKEKLSMVQKKASGTFAIRKSKMIRTAGIVGGVTSKFIP